MYDTITILRDVVLEARTSARDLEYDDPIVENLRYIEEMTNTAIKNLETHIGDTNATGT